MLDELMGLTLIGSKVVKRTELNLSFITVWAIVGWGEVRELILLANISSEKDAVIPYVRTARRQFLHRPTITPRRHAIL